MTVRWCGNSLWITALPVDAMGRLAACAPQGQVETEVLAALLGGGPGAGPPGGAGIPAIPQKRAAGGLPPVHGAGAKAEGDGRHCC